MVDPHKMVGLPEGDYTVKELKQYIKMMKEESIYDYDVDVSTNDDIVSLITCTGLLSDGTIYNDIIVSGKLVLDGESAKAYSVEKTAKYKNVENEMKGDDEDE